MPEGEEQFRRRIIGEDVMAEKKTTISDNPLPPGRWQTGDVHIDVTQIVAEAPLYSRPAPKGKPGAKPGSDPA